MHVLLIGAGCLSVIIINYATVISVCSSIPALAIYVWINPYYLFVPGFPRREEKKKKKTTNQMKSLNLQDFLIDCMKVWVCLCVRKWWETCGCDVCGSIWLRQMHKGKVKPKKKEETLCVSCWTHWALTTSPCHRSIWVWALGMPHPRSQAHPYLQSGFWNSWPLAPR